MSISDLQRLRGTIWTGQAKCQICNVHHDLCIHHKDESRDHNEEANLVVLCQECHRKYDVELHPKNGNGRGKSYYKNDQDKWRFNSFFT